jgi:acyl carrier protein
MNYQHLVTESVKATFGPDYEFDFDDRFDHHGDSLDFLSLLMEIEDRLDISLHEEDYPNAVTFTQLVDHIQEIHA